MDMHSGGGCKEPYQFILIEAPEAEAKVIFQNRFSHNPDRVTCTCCGGDYSIDDYESLEQATGFDRNAAFVYLNPAGEEVPLEQAWKAGVGLINGCINKYVERKGHDFAEYKTLEEFLKRPDVLVIKSQEIKPEERQGELRTSGYVWVD